MSFFLGDASQYSNANVDPERIQLAEVQFEAMSNTFNNVLRSCRNKCIAQRYGEGELNTGELSCSDRCVAKYVKANVLVGTHIQEEGYDLLKHMPEYKKIESILKEATRKSTNQ